MPNWCDNYVEISGPKDRVLGLLDQSLRSGFLSAIKPLIREPAEKHKIYEWCNSNWGTKWEVDLKPDYIVATIDNVKNMSLQNVMIGLSFFSATTPPIAAYQVLITQGFNIRGYYYESNNAFYGWFKNGKEKYFDIDGFDNIDTKIVEIFSISPEDHPDE